MRWITLTHYDHERGHVGAPTDVNAELITHYHPIGNYTVIHFSGGTHVDVIESPADIRGLMDFGPRYDAALRETLEELGVRV